jgi:hypothetical protein
VRAGPRWRCQKQQTEGKIMKTKTRIKAGGIAVNHNETLVRQRAR